MAGMEKILNFNEPLDVSLLDRIVDALYGANGADVCLVSLRW